MMDFFKRTNVDLTIARTGIVRSISLLLIQIIVLVIVGSINYGCSFFTVNHWITKHGVIIDPSIGIMAIIVVLFLILRTSLDLILSRGSYIGIRPDAIIINRRKIYKLSEYDCGNTRLTGPFRNILRIPKKAVGRPYLTIPLVFSKDRADVVFHAIKGLELR